MEDKVIAKVERKAGEEIRFQLREYKGFPFIDVRLYYEDDNGQWNPTKKGVTLSPDQVDDLKMAVDSVWEEIKNS